jgi:type 1 fimbria pilin
MCVPCRLWTRFILLGATLSLFAAIAWAQASYEAQIRGTVTDQSGAIVVNATVTITNDATNISQRTHSGAHGEYFIVGLRPAVYTIKAESKGFETNEKRNIVLQVAQH